MRSTAGSSVGSTSKRWTVTGRASRSTSIPCRASSCRRLPPICTADTIGGTCRIAPVNVAAAARAASIVTGAMSCVAVTSPAASSVDVFTPSTTSATYVFGCAVRNRSSRVTLPTPTSSTPVASGSSVPACPTFFVCRMPRSLATTSCDVHPAALSMTTRPLAPSTIRFKVAQHVLDATGLALDGVRLERQHGSALHACLRRDRALQADAHLVERFDHGVVALGALGRVDEDRRMPQIGVDDDAHDRHELEPFVIGPFELVGEDLTDQLVESRRARVRVGRPPSLHQSPTRWLRAGDLALFERFDDVARLQVLEVGEADAALEAGLHLAH